MKKKHTINLTTKYTIIICVLLLGINATLGFWLMRQSGTAMMSLVSKHMIAVADTTAAALDGDVLESITEEDIGSDEYNRIYKTLTKIRNTQKDEDIKYIYTTKKGGEHFVFIIDPDPVEPGLYGEDVVYTPAQDVAWSGTSAVDSVTFADKWGEFYTAWSPVKNSDGEVVALVGVDFVPDWFSQQVAAHTRSVLINGVLSLVAGLLIMLLMTWQLRRRIGSVNSELITLSHDVEKLSNDIRTSPGGKSDEAEETEQIFNTNTIGALTGKIKAMRKNLKDYMDYANEQAFSDSMTGVGNKTAYLDYINEINKKINDGTAAFAVAVFDINGLKSTNDNFGHECGDRIITDTAAILRRAFEDEKVFRIGGDEFIAVMGETTEAELDEKLDQIKEAIDAFNTQEKQYTMTLSFSGGGAVYHPGEDSDFKAVFKRADEQMYRNKGDFYRQFGDRRRQYYEEDK